MIVKHVTEALRRQDWIAVAIEFLLVVVGVLLAFQINEWSSEREARAERAAATERLLGEAEDTVSFFRGGVERQHHLLDDLGYALDKVQNHRSAGADRERMTAGLSRAIEATTPVPPSSVYDDIVASGSFGKIGDPQLRSAIARYRSTLLFHAQTINYLQLRMPKFEDYGAFHYVYDPKAPMRARLIVDFPALERDRALQEKLAIVANWQGVALVLRERSLKRAIEMCRELGRVTGRTCNEHRPLPTFR